MYLKITTDHARFRNIIKGKVKKDLRKYISNAESLGVKGGRYISIPMPTIDLPHFEFGKNEQSGVGSGDGKEGDSVGQPEDGDGGGKAGNAAGTHIQEVDVTLEEMAEMLGEELGLPRIQPKGDKNILAQKSRYTSVHNLGPKSLLHFRRTYKEALKRQISMADYDPLDPSIIPQSRDFRYRSYKELPVENNSAVIIFMMDVSGSMGDEQKSIVRTQSFWIDTWLRSQYKGLETRFIVHDAVAHEVDRETFFSTRESGGTIISSAYVKALELIEREFPPEQWNVYLFHFSDGDNWSADDSKKCFELLEKKLLPVSNLFAYGQVESLYGSGQFYRDLTERFQASDSSSEKIVATRIPNREAIYDSIKEFLKKGL
ncbi:MAG: DUF444 family protein [Bradymonadales bacterium]|nr:MAG: DUF444 family protein [Bradymonadales bacterium]